MGEAASLTWYRLSRKEALGSLQSDAETGLSEEQARRRLVDIGPNQMAEPTRRSIPAMLFGQLADFMIHVLLAAAMISGFTGELHDTLAIVVIVVLNAVIGAVQKYRAERAVAALRRLAEAVAC